MDKRGSGAVTKGVYPSGICWCGCGEVPGRRSFFQSGHDKRAESAVILVQYGGVPEFLRAHGYGPDGKNAMDELGKWRERGKGRR